ncbi:hypothetical protein Tco_0025116, partial [Tanacetum coccineum]
LKTLAKAAKPSKKKQPAKTSKAKGLTVLSEVALTEAEQMKLATKRSLIQTHSSHASGLSADEGTGGKPGAPDVPTYESDDEQISWKSSDEEDDDDDNNDDDDNDDVDDDVDNQDDDGQDDNGQEYDGQDDEGQDDDNEQTDSDNDGDDFVHPKFSTRDQEERQDDEDKEEECSDDEAYDDKNQGANVEGEELDEEETNEEDKANELYRDVNVNLEGRDTEMTDAPRTIVQTTQVIEDTHVIITLVNPEGQQQSSSVSSGFIFNMLNPSPDTGIDSIFNLNNESTSLVDVPISMTVEMPPSSATTIPPPPVFLIQPLQQTHVSTPTIVPSTSLQNLPTFDSVFKFEDKKPTKPPTPDRDWNKTLPAAHGPIQPWISSLARKEDTRDSFNELMDTPLDFSAFVMNRLKVDTLTPELLAGPTFELMKGSCKSLVELEYFLEEVYKATTDQLDWNNPKGQQYPHDLRKPLPLIPNSQGRRVIPFDHFINNDLEYLRGGTSSRTYATSVTKTKAADYGHVKWIEDLVPNTMWSPVPVIYDKYALWGISHWGRKRQQFYGFAVNRESARDVYSRHRIIAVTKLQIVEWHNYKHLDWITVRRNDDKLYTFKEGDYKRLRLQDIEDMLLLLVQGKLTNLTIEERLALNVSLRMFTRSIVIQRRIKDLQLGNKDKKNKLMRIDELHKFSDGTLNDVRTALNDILKRIRMKYLP